MKLSLISPSRNNLKYLKWSYDSVRKHMPLDVEYCVASDYSTDGTVEWCEEISKKDKNFKYIVNDGSWFGENKGELDRMGHTLLYDKLINEVATGDAVMIWHSDMYMAPECYKEIEKYLEPGTVVSLTRIEPPLHPGGSEKILADYGIETEEFQEERFLREYMELSPNKEPTEGIFAPWTILKEDFQSIGGHDPLYAPQSKEDSDIFNRFQLNGYKFIQTWRGYCYHMTCRGSRFKDGALRNPAGQVFMKGRESTEWLEQNFRSTRNFIRKWGSMVKHDEYLKPIISPKYNIGFAVKNCDMNMLRELEPWCSDIYGDFVGHKGYGVNQYIEEEQKNTMFDLSKKIHSSHFKPKNDVVVKFDCMRLNQQNFQILVNLPEILKESGEVGEMALEIFQFFIKSLDTYEKDLIKVKKK